MNKRQRIQQLIATLKNRPLTTLKRITGKPASLGRKKLLALVRKKLSTLPKKSIESRLRYHAKRLRYEQNTPKPHSHYHFPKSKSCMETFIIPLDSKGEPQESEIQKVIDYVKRNPQKYPDATINGITAGKQERSSGKAELISSAKMKELKVGMVKLVMRYKAIMTISKAGSQFAYRYALNVIFTCEK